jgi:DNA-binding NtrC family response regulator
MATPDSLSVLIVDEDPDILAFFARILSMNGIRALLARTPDEAMGIAKRGYVPIDLVMTDLALRSSPGEGDFASGRDLVEDLRRTRPEIKALFMSSYLDSGVIRVQLMDRNFETSSKNPDHEGLIESIRRAARVPRTYSAGMRQ